MCQVEPGTVTSAFYFNFSFSILVNHHEGHEEHEGENPGPRRAWDPFSLLRWPTMMCPGTSMRRHNNCMQRTSLRAAADARR